MLCEQWGFRNRERRYYHKWVKNALRSGLVLLSVVLALSIPEFSLFVSLVGAVGSSLLAFILPCVFYMWIFRHTRPKWHMALNGILVVFGVVGSAVSIVVTVAQIIEAVF